MRPNKQNARENRRGFENRQNSVFLALPNRIRQSQGFFFKASLRPFSKVASPHFIYSPEAQSGSTISRKTTERTERAVPPIRAENPYFYNRHRLVLFSKKSKDNVLLRYPIKNARLIKVKRLRSFLWSPWGSNPRPQH